MSLFPVCCVEAIEPQVTELFGTMFERREFHNTVLTCHFTLLTLNPMI